MPEHYSKIAHALTTFAAQTCEAADDLMEAGQNGGELSAQTQRVIAAWQGFTAAPTTYQHPTPEAIAADDETKEFALVCAVRALQDALAQSALAGRDRQFAAALLLDSLGSPDETGSALTMARAHKGAKVPYDRAMRLLSKALTMAALHGREGTPLPPEMLDFVKKQALMVEQDRITLPVRLVGAGVAGLRDVQEPAPTLRFADPVHLNINGAGMAAALAASAGEASV